MNRLLHDKPTEGAFLDELAALKRTRDFSELRRVDPTGATLSLPQQWRRVTLAAVLVKIAVQRLWKSCKEGGMLNRLGAAHGEDYPVPLHFLEHPHPALPLETGYDATVYYCVEMLLYQHLEKNHPLDSTAIHAERAMDGDKPLNLTSIYINTQVFLRKAAIGDFLEREMPEIMLCRGAYKSMVALYAKNPFDHAGGSLTERSILITELAHYCIVLDRLFQETYYDRLVGDSHNAACFKTLDGFRRKATDPSAPAPGSVRWSDHIACFARKIVRYFDEWGLGRSNEEDAPPDFGPIGSAGGGFDLGGVCGNRQLTGRAFGRKSMICGREIDVEYEQPLSAAESWKFTSRQVAEYVETIDQQLSRILCERSESAIRTCQETGDVYWPDLYRREGDIRIFEDAYSRPSSKNAFYVVLLQDCSCSINADKRVLLTPILCLLVNVILKRPDDFIYLAAYQQHSSGNKRVTLRRSIDQPTAQIIDPSPAIHLAQSGVNYDAFALAEVIQTHCQDYRGPDPVREETLLAMVVGDFWPVSQTGQNSADESKQVYRELKASYPNLVLCGIGVNPCYSGDALYDHYVSLKHTDPIPAFANQFTLMIDQIVATREEQS